MLTIQLGLTTHTPAPIIAPVISTFFRSQADAFKAAQYPCMRCGGPIERMADAEEVPGGLAHVEGFCRIVA